MNMKLCPHQVLRSSGAYEVFRELNNEVQTRNSIKDIMFFSALAQCSKTVVTWVHK